MPLKNAEEEILKLRDAFDLRFFVETGTLHGKTAAWAAGHFEKVYTIEISKRHYERAKKRYRRDNVRFIFGDSALVLPIVLEALNGPALCWLDAHWSPDLKVPHPPGGECPVLMEITALNADGRDHVILIDDARYFLESPSRGHRASDWPNFEELRELLGDREIRIKNDVIYAAPRTTK